MSVSVGGTDKIGPGIDRRTALQAGAAAALALATSARARGARARIGGRMLRGVNLAGAEFGTAMPGLFGRDYTYPDDTSFQRFGSLGFDCIRLPFRWERLQPDLGAPFDEAEWSRLSGAIGAAARAGQTLILDLHNYARRKVRADGFSTEHLVGSPQVPGGALAQLWAGLAARVREQSHVVLGIMNEPTDLAPSRWLPIANDTIAAIRKAGAEHLILAPGIDWTGAHSWYASGNTLMERLVDPARNMAIEVHQYLDTDSSGRSGQAVSPMIGTERLEAFQEWARARRLMAFLGEFGGGSGATSVAAIENMLIDVESNPDVWIGWTAWAAGPWWPPAEPLRLEPDEHGSWPAQVTAMAQFTRPSTEPTGKIAGSAIDLDLARGRCHGVQRLADVLVVSRPGVAMALRRDGGLDSFDADVPRINDLGLTIEGAGRNALDSMPAADARMIQAVVERGPREGLRVWELITDRGAVAWPLAGATQAAAPFVTFSLHIRADPLAGGTLEASLGGARAEVDLARMLVRWSSEGAVGVISGSGAWRRVGLTVPATAAAGARPVLTLRGVSPGGRVLVACPMLDNAPGVTAFVAGARAADAVTLRGDIMRLMRADAFTLLVETRALTAAPVELPLLSDGSVSLLHRRPNGAVACPALHGAATRPIALERWRPRRRIVVVVSRREGRIVLATTGEAPRSVVGRWPMPRGETLRLAGAEGVGDLDGVIARIAVLPMALGAKAAADLTG